ncbi:hypothetical protein, partial [Gemelliphila asaccharolytica]
TYKDTTKVFKEWDSTVPDTGEVQEQEFTADYKDVVKTGTDPKVKAQVGYTRVTFDAGDGNTIDGTNRYKYIDVLTGTEWDNEKVTKEIPKSATYKDNTKVFDKWSEKVPDTGEVQKQEFTAEYKANKEAKDKKELEDAKEALKPIIEKKFQDPKQKASVLKDLAKLKTLKEVEQLKADIEGS